MVCTFWTAWGFIFQCPAKRQARAYGCHSHRWAGQLTVSCMHDFGRTLVHMSKVHNSCNLWRLEDLSAFVVQDAINFAIFASSATSVSLVLFTEEDLQAGCTTHEIKLSPQLNRTGGVWHIMLPKLDTSLLYGLSNAQRWWFL